MARNKGCPGSQAVVFILQQLGKEGLCHWESFPLAAPKTTMRRNILAVYGKPMKVHSGKQALEATGSRPSTTSASMKMSLLLICIPDWLSW